MLVYMDVSAIPIAIPTLEKEFSLTTIEGLWIVNTYLLTLLAFYLISGKLSQIYGKKKLFLTGFFIFGIGSLLAALSPTGWWLIMSRAIQGLGGAFSFPSLTGILVEHFPVNERAKAMGINSGISSICLLLGPAIGGFFVQYLSWRYIFWINLPIIAYGLISSMLIIPADTIKKGNIHLSGAFFAMIASSALVIGLMEGGELEWTSAPVIALFSIAVICALLFYYVSKDAEDPLIEFSLLRNLQFNALNFCAFLLQIIICFNIFLAIYLQKALGYSPIQAGMLIVQGSLPIILLFPAGGYLSDHLSPKIPLIGGFFLMILGFGLFFWLIEEKNYFFILTSLLLIGSGGALVRAPSFTVALHAIHANHLIPAVTLLKANRQFAATFGLALIAAVIKSASEEGSYEKGAYFLVLLFLIFSCINLLISIFFTKPPKKNHEH